MAFRLSKPVQELKPHYDVVVVGSGYGASVAASRLSRCGRKTALLERGKEYSPGSFPNDLSQARDEFQLSGCGRHFGPPTALMDFRYGEDIHVLLGCGLGGTSLINANVCLRPDPRVFQDSIWPEALRGDGTLWEGFARARRMLRPVTYSGEPALKKLDALGMSARALGVDLDYPPLHITFDERANAANIIQPACTLCGDCCSGCNVGAKTTTVVTYLADAAAFGAEIYTGTTVSFLGKNDDGSWTVHFCPTDLDSRKTIESPDLQTITAKAVVLGAGTLGSNEILLRSKGRGLAVSDRLGHGFTGNGDMITMGYNNDVPINGVGVGFPAKVAGDPVGPAVAGLVDLRNTPELNDGIGLVEASIPSSSAALLAPMLVPGGKIFADDTDRSFDDQLDEMGRAALSLVKGAYEGAVHHTQTFLAIGHDDAGGQIVLEDGEVRIKWPGLADQKIYEKIDEICARAVAATGGSYMRNPLSNASLGGNPLSVHPLGGCAMADDISGGVVDHKCEIYDASPSSPPGAVHDGLYVCDGSVLPRSVGIHPLFTITAIAERAMLHIARDKGWQFDDRLRQGQPQRLI